jgi:hypothetical protein
MNETLKTCIFLVVAGALGGTALYNHLGSRPTNEGDFELVGKPFFEDFQSTSDAASLEVMSIDPQSLNLQRFSVQNDKSIWKIPSHHNYPAEAAARLAETASSVMGISRLSLAGGPADFARMGVIDPLEIDEEKIDDPEEIGKRVTLRDHNGEVLVDLIIGKSAGEVSRPDLDPSINAGASPATYVYVRRPDEQQVYKSLININLSTRFSDWIDPDLLRVNSGKIMRLDVDNYELTESNEGFLGQVKRLYKAQGDRVQLNRPSFTDAWQLVGLNPEEEELNLTRIQSSLEILSDLVIAGVRPKFKFKGHLLLTPDLKFNQVPEMEENIREAQLAVSQFQDELEDRGFSLAGTQDKLEIASFNGQLQIGTDEGVLYTLFIGKAVEGSEKEIEIGGAKTVEDANTPEEQEKIANYREEEKNRYVMISVAFDETLLGPRPVQPQPPVEPVKPEGYIPANAEAESSSATDNTTNRQELSEGSEPAAAEDQKSEAASEASSSADQEPSGNESPVPPVRDPEFVLYDDAMAKFEQDKIDYELELTRSNEELKQFNEKATEGSKLVDELNQRFADWYYVIKGSNLRTLQLKRADVVQPRADLQKEKEAEAAKQGLPAFPNLDFTLPENAQEGDQPDAEPDESQAGTPSEESQAKEDPPGATEPAPVPDDPGAGGGSDESIQPESTPALGRFKLGWQSGDPVRI